MAFEDNVDIARMLQDAGVKAQGCAAFHQAWDGRNAVQVIKQHKPDVVLVDYFMPGENGRDVVRSIVKAAAEGTIPRPQLIIGISSEAACNDVMVRNGADYGIVKLDLPSLKLWGPLRT